MSKEHVQRVVLSHLHRLIPETAAAPVNLDAPLNELGVDSLDLLDVTSQAMMELGVKLPRSEVSGIKRLQDIIDALDRARAAQETPAP
ncbi:phosphopantetheine-binding protein [Myxococcota bacterium]|nr:phosphopantetheine-binding protein [Myxococcota bacterium]